MNWFFSQTIFIISLSLHSVAILLQKLSNTFSICNSYLVLAYLNLCIFTLTWVQQFKMWWSILISWKIGLWFLPTITSEKARKKKWKEKQSSRDAVKYSQVHSLVEKDFQCHVFGEKMIYFASPFDDVLFFREGQCNYRDFDRWFHFAIVFFPMSVVCQRSIGNTYKSFLSMNNLQLHAHTDEQQIKF